jgi:hypothetical protein
LRAGGLGRHRFRHAVRGKDHGPVVRHLVELVDEDRALGLEVLDHEAIVDDLVPDIDRPAVTLQRRSTIWMARSTPAQKPRGLASRIVSGFFGAIMKFVQRDADPFACGPADHCLESAQYGSGAAP